MDSEMGHLCNLQILMAAVKMTIWFNSIYSVIINKIVNIYAMSCETASDSKHKLIFKSSHFLSQC